MPFAPAYGHLAAFVLGDLARYYGPSVLSSSLGGYLGYKAGKLYKSYFKRGKKMPMRRKPALRGRDPATLPGFNPRKRARSDKESLYAEDNPGYVQRSDWYGTYRLGRWVPRPVKAMNILTSHVDKIVERFQLNSANALADSVVSQTGSFVLPCGPNTAYGGKFHLPIYLFDLSGVYNNNSHTAGNEYPTVGYTVIKNASVSPFSGNYNYWGGVTGVNTDSTTAVYSWLTEKVGTATAIPKVGQSCYIDSAKVNLAIWGAREVPCKVFVELWQFNDETIAPPLTSGSSTTAVPSDFYPANDAERQNEFWDNYFGSVVGTGIGVRGWRSDAKGVYRRLIKSIDFNPISTLEKDTDGHQRNVHLYLPMNKYMKMDWRDTANDINGLNIPDPDYFEKTTGATNEMPFPHPTKRVFLVVRAQVAQGHATAAGLATVRDKIYPSFDMIIRRYRSSIKT